MLCSVLSTLDRAPMSVPSLSRSFVSYIDFDDYIVNDMSAKDIEDMFGDNNAVVKNDAAITGDAVVNNNNMVILVNVAPSTNVVAPGKSSTTHNDIVVHVPSRFPTRVRAKPAMYNPDDYASAHSSFSDEPASYKLAIASGEAAQLYRRS